MSFNKLHWSAEALLNTELGMSDCRDYNSQNAVWGGELRAERLMLGCVFRVGLDKANSRSPPSKERLPSPPKVLEGSR